MAVQARTFLFCSELAIPELRVAKGFVGREVRVKQGKVPDKIAGSTWVDSFCCLTAQEWMLHMPKVARFYVAHGREILIDAEPDAPPEDVRIYLLGSCFGVLCYQNGLVPLHASAVARQGQVAAFLGESGAGKSTLVGSLAQRGYAIVADDICLLE